MKKLFFLCIATIVPFFCLAQTTPTKVRVFYDGMMKLEKAKGAEAAVIIQNEMAGCFAGGTSGLMIKIDDMSSPISSTLYTMRLHDDIYVNKKLQVTVTIGRSENVTPPDQNRGMEKPTHIMTYVTKTCNVGGKVITYDDIVATKISDGLITELTNSVSTGTTTGGNTVQPTVTTTYQDISLEQLRVRAAYCYSKGLHTQAYELYEEIVKRYPNDGDANYRIGILTFWRKGCKHRFKKKEAENKAKIYMEKARIYGNSEISNKAENLLTNWNQHNIYF